MKGMCGKANMHSMAINTHILMTLKFISLFNLSPEFQSYESNRLLDRPIPWMSNRHLKLVFLNTVSYIYPCKWVFYQ